MHLSHVGSTSSDLIEIDKQDGIEREGSETNTIDVSESLGPF